MKKILIFVAASSMLLCNCRKPEPDSGIINPEPPIEQEPAEQERIPITLNTDISTKATDSGYENGDRVGIYTVNNIGEAAGILANSGNHLDNVKFTFDGTSWNPDSPVYWKDQTTAADFYCYYPYTPSISNVLSIPFTVKTDQSALEDYKASEFFWGKTEAAKPSKDPVDIMTRHAMSNIIIHVKPGKGYTDETLAAENIAVTITGLKTSARINLATGEVTAEEGTGDIIPYKGDGYWRALIVPQDITDAEIMKVNVGSYEYTLRQTASFQSNKQHKCTVVINRIGEGVNIGISGWETDDTDFGGTLD